MSKNKVRGMILDIPGKERYEIIRSVISRFNYAIEQDLSEVTPKF